MPGIDYGETPHRRYNPLTREWVLVSPHRTKRPWQGQVERTTEERRPRYDPRCYLCPGNSRAGGDATNPQYTGTYVFTNDFAALLEDVPSGEVNDGGLLQARSERGICRVVCFSPDHSLGIPDLSVAELRAVVDVWAQEYAELGGKPHINYVQIFQNNGAVMGASNPHPHGQIWSNETVPQIPTVETASMAAYLAEHGSCMLCDYTALELERRERLVCENDHFAVVVPFWAVWPFETLVLAKRHVGSLLDLDSAERTGLGEIIKRLTTRYDNLFETSFPYSMGLHQQPTDGHAHEEWHFHIHYYPPLLRSATVRKFMVGYEMLGNPQRDVTAEGAAQRLAALSEVRFGER
ncbi:MAG: UDP-glucose--hexose-1-phosphate uridylyltransferase [Chloroflexi bacterium]|nr:UDP-glucose--hexose-1-phosphate uridylyltransferase [Chloroflexota bacterium]